ncbi:SDR family NAD(P)-dependent oxidoreductase [Deltaproteobacteria bacterium]|nr:SDR family NAD(P)-dependent oxidoreductase [Deltaproteobacteria bacterium]
MPKSILITGASSGIGRALAFEFSRRGYALGLSARRLELLESLRDELGRETQVAIAKLDVADLERVPEVLHKIADQLGGVQIVIANAGVGERSYPGEGTFHLDSKVIEINVLGAMATIDAGTEILKKEGGGQIVGISSVAGFRGLSTTPAYSASKAALSTYMEGIRNNLKQHKIAVTVLNPGFIDTPINSHRKSRPFLISAEKGARLMADMIEKKVWSSTVPVWPWALITKLMRLLPERLWSKINF